MICDKKFSFYHGENRRAEEITVFTLHIRGEKGSSVGCERNDMEYLVIIFG